MVKNPPAKWETQEIVNQVQEAKRVPYRINPRRNMPRHILINHSVHREYSYTGPHLQEWER